MEMQTLYDAYYEISQPKYVEQVSADARNWRVSEVKDGGVDTQRLFALGTFVWNWGLIGVAPLIFIAVFLISNTIFGLPSFHVVVRQTGVIGRKNGYIRAPFL